MRTVAPKLCYSNQRQRTPQALFVTGAEPAGWLEHIGCWQVEQELLRLLPVPTSWQDRTPRGVLVVFPDDVPPPAGLCPAYGRAADSLFVPVEAYLDPEPTPQEWREMLAADATYVWHPATGLIRFELKDVRRVVDLLVRPTFLKSTWNRGQSGLHFPHRMMSLTPVQTPTVETIIEQGRGEIGSQAGDLSQLPPLPEEGSPNALDKGIHAARQWVARWVLRATSMAPAITERPTWVDKWRQWAEQQLWGDSLYAQRNKEIDRLQRLLESDPDQGLRYAIPLTGDGSRGVARPTRTLTPRSTDFNLNNLGGGRPTDAWGISFSQHLALVGKYRQLANRELTLGRHRRAAYILAELLGDFHGAANALVQGRHYREAAVLYRDRLNTPQQAAECLEKGGLINEAIEIYQDLEEFEKAGDRLAQIKRHDDAQAMYRLQVDKLVFRSSRIEAANVLDRKLGSPQEAADVLTEGWPDREVDGPSLEKLFSILGRAGFHDQSAAWIARITSKGVPGHFASDFATILAEQSQTYPDQTVRGQARDSTLGIVARFLEEGTTSERAQLLAAMKMLAPHDRLLDRDCQRFLRKQQKPPIRVAVRSSVIMPLQPQRQFQIPGQVRWKSVLASRDRETFYLVGEENGSLRLARFNYLGKAEVSKPLFPVNANEPRFQLLSLEMNRSEEVLLTSPHRPPTLSIVAFTSSAHFPSGVTLKNLNDMLSSTVAVAEDHGLWLVCVHAGVPMVMGPGGSGFALPVDAAAAADCHLYVRRQKPYIGCGNILYIYDSGYNPRTIEMGKPIRAIVGADPSLRTRIAVLLTEGGVLIWDDLRCQQNLRFARELRDPVLAFVPAGKFLCASLDGLQLYSTHNEKLTLIGESPSGPDRPIGVVSSNRPPFFAVCYESGEIHIFSA